ncbi:unnamed protein product [Didymodactylos carnosus]|uniref:Uncharacterized protein n=1 Tax=Didymodactylos carnosus TaxID=1234261 RepID=A0A8S2PWT7_9BILA|nr:unnamed protein product [Didymodactylos carnosus]CAF4076809.1 unnamed protein product [Didymodactylos carnosus]
MHSFLTETETKYAEQLAVLQQHTTSDMPKKHFILRLMSRFDGDVEIVRKCLEKLKTTNENKDQLREKYGKQLAELESNGFNIKCPCIYKLLEKYDGDVTKVREIKQHQLEKKKNTKISEEQYSEQLKQLKNEGVKLKNKRVIVHLLKEANGEVAMVKKFLLEEQNKNEEKKESPTEKKPHAASQEALSANDLADLEKLQNGGVRGNPFKILKIFHECNNSVELTAEKCRQHKEQRKKAQEEREKKHELINDTQNSYHTVAEKNDWPTHVTNVYLDGNNMMFVVDSLRRLCLNRQGKKTEKAIAEIASAWNEQMNIANLNLIYDSTRQLASVGTVHVQSAHPTFQTTDDMLIDIMKKRDKEINEHTVVVTSDRYLAAQLITVGCILVKPYHWFAHCVMVLAPDLIKEDLDGVEAKLTEKQDVGDRSKSQNRKGKKHYDFDQLVKRIVKMDK